MTREGLASKPRDSFDRWYENLPEERKFSQSAFKSLEEALEFDKWMKKIGHEQSPDYDYVGAFQAGHTPDKSGHMGSIGNDGKILKDPRHETFWKTALTEILGGMGHDPNRAPWDKMESRQDGLRYLSAAVKVPGLGSGFDPVELFFAKPEYKHDPMSRSAADRLRKGPPRDIDHPDIIPDQRMSFPGQHRGFVNNRRPKRGGGGY